MRSVLALAVLVGAIACEPAPEGSVEALVADLEDGQTVPVVRRIVSTTLRLVLS